MSEETQKLQTHLDLLRDEYVKQQCRLAEVERKYQVALAATGQSETDNFVSRLLKIVSNLFDKELYSDLTIHLDGKDIHGHRFVLAARSDSWGVSDLAQVSSLDLKDISFDVSYALLRWVYTDHYDLYNVDDVFLLNLLRAAKRFKLDPLSIRCEQSLMSSVTVRNCIRFYQTAEEIGATDLKNHCSQLISSHWDDFTSEDFESMSASLAYHMFKSKSEYPLHTAVRHKREDVVFLYLVEHDSQLPGKLNDLDNRGDLPIDLALQGRCDGIAQTLVKHRVDVNRPDQKGYCLLHKAIRRGDDYSARFLIENGANVNAVTSDNRESPLHLLADFNNETSEVVEQMADIAKLLLKYKADPNLQDSRKCTALHRCLERDNSLVFDILLADTQVNLELGNSEGHPVLWLALTLRAPVFVEGDETFPKESYACRLMTRGSSPNFSHTDSGNTLLHLSAKLGHEEAGLFLSSNGANVNATNVNGETPLHCACARGLSRLIGALLERGASANIQTLTPPDDSDQVYKLTPIHLAIASNNRSAVAVLLDFRAKVIHSSDNLKIIPNLTLKDSTGQTPLGVAICRGMRDIAEQLLEGGANINDVDSEGRSLLVQAILRKDVEGALFLLNNQADHNARMPVSGESCLQLSVKNGLTEVVDRLCQLGAAMNVIHDVTGNCLLWDSLVDEQNDIATILVKHGCDVNAWSEGPNKCQQTLLHRAIDENQEPIACFLVRSNCDVNSPRRPGPNGEGDEESRDQQSPLHLSATWGLTSVVQCLLDYNADVNAKDVESETALHIAIQNQHSAIISLLLAHSNLNVMARNKRGLTPFAVAMATKNNIAAKKILDREPTAAEQFDNRGRNFLHTAVQKTDIEAVLFLISVHVNVNSRQQDSTQMTPLHLAVIGGAEMICRNLLLAGARINDVTPQKQSALHLAAHNDRASICTILIENGINVDALDDCLNNALHIAVQMGNLGCVRSLLTGSNINAEAVNMRGQNPLHVLGQCGKENSAAIFDLFIECMPQYPIDNVDANGNTVLLLAYINGNGSLCRAVVRASARLGIANRDGISIFNSPVATKKLLFSLLDMLSREPPWVDGETCLECGVKFGIKTRKHHCRHCGRLLCAKCSGKDMPIVKYNISKPVRICEICFDVLALGSD